MELEDTTSGGSSSVAGEPDRLSALLDCLLHTIFSFMKARQVVQTCVLSTRWQNLWPSAPSLDIDLDEFKLETMFKDVANNDKDWEDFEDFAINLMYHHDSFRLNVPEIKAPQFGKARASTWLHRAMKYCTSDPGIRRKGLGSNSWCLKRLHLLNIFLDSRFAEHVTSVCHSLEDLELHYCTCQFPALTSNSLKNLVMRYCNGTLDDITLPTLNSLFIDGGSYTNDSMVITAPALTCLEFDNSYYDISVNEMPVLDKASIHLSDCNWIEIQSEQFKLLCRLSYVTHLRLTYFGTLVPSLEFTTFKEFKNLRNLALELCDLSDDFPTLLTLFLRNSPNLENLTLWLCKCQQLSNDSDEEKGTPKLKTASSSRCHSLDVQCPNLKLTEMVYEDDDICQLAEFMLCISWNLPNNKFKLRKKKILVYRWPRPCVRLVTFFFIRMCVYVLCFLQMHSNAIVCFWLISR